jgi:hypothetical protein
MEKLSIKEAKSKMFSEYKFNPNFVGVSIVENDVLKVMLVNEIALPSVYEGYPVETEITGYIFLQNKSKSKNRRRKES